MTSTRGGQSRGRGERRNWRGEELTLGEVLYVLWGRRLMVLCITAFFVAVVALYVASREQIYLAESRVEVDVVGGASGQAATGSYLENVAGVIASSDRLLSEAVRTSGWNGSLADFRESLDTEYYADGDGRSGILVRFSAGRPEDSADGANAYAELLAERIPEVELAGFSGDIEANASVASRAGLGSVSGGYTPALYVAGAGIAGLIVGGAAALLLDSRTRSWRGAQDAELTLHSPVLGEIPDFRTLGYEGYDRDDGDTDTDDERAGIT